MAAKAVDAAQAAGAKVQQAVKQAANQASQAAHTAAVATQQAAQKAAAQAQQAAQAAKQAIKTQVIPAAQKAATQAAKTFQAIANRTKEQGRKAVTGIKKIASATRKVADEKVLCPLQKTYAKGRENAKAANKEKAKWSVEPPSPDMFDPAAGRAGIGASVKVEKAKSFLKYGDEDNFVKIGNAKASAAAGYEYDPLEKSHTVSVVKVEAGVSAIEVQHKGKHAGGLLEHEVAAEALAAKVAAEASVKVDAKGFEAKAQAGAQATLVKASGKGYLSLTPKTIYENTIGKAVNFISPGSKYAKVSDKWDHGVVLGAAGEIGIGAAAKAEAAIGRIDGVWGATAGVTAGAGPMAGVKFFLGIK
ncbi:MAG: hypothetical protein NTW21_12125 [Verrucomicrobia bacterium]|nr:hypothetical protein [Verrucomicrobiota bacterium]